MFRKSHLALSGALALAAPTIILADSDWASWRGPNGTGYVAESRPPVQWGADQNVRWKTEIPGHGYSTPVVHGERLYLMSAVEVAGTATPQAEPEQQAQQRSRRRGGAPQAINIHQFFVIAVNRKDGSIAWSTKVKEEKPHQGHHQTATYAPSSCVTDGEHIFAGLGSRGIFCLDMQGDIVWEKDLGDMNIAGSFGEGATPALRDDTLIVPWDHQGDSFVYALDKRTGEEKWKVARDEPTTWSTPAIVDVNGATQVIMPGTNACISYDFATGKELWRSAGLTRNVIPTPVLGNGMVYLMSGYGGAMVRAIKLGEARGEVSDTPAEVWTHNRATPYVPSPMLTGPRLYFLGNNNGLLTCLNALTGEPHYAGQRMELNNIYASIVGAGNHVYVCSREGDVAVLEDGDTYKVLATNNLGEAINASPAIVGNEIYLRGEQHLYCIAETAE